MGISISQPWSERLPDGRTVDEALRELLRRQAIESVAQTQQPPAGSMSPSPQTPQAPALSGASALKVPEIQGGGDITAQLEAAGDGALRIGADGKLTLSPGQAAQPPNMQTTSAQAEQPAPPSASTLKVPDLTTSPAQPPSKPAYGEAMVNNRGECIIPFNANPESPAFPSLDAKPEPSSAPGVSRARVAQPPDPLEEAIRKQEQDELAQVTNGKRGIKNTLKSAVLGGLQGLAATGDVWGAIGGAGAGAAAGTVDPNFYGRQQHDYQTAQRGTHLDRALARRKDLLALQTAGNKPAQLRYEMEEKERDNLRQIYNSQPYFDPQRNLEHAIMASRAAALGMPLPKRDEKDQTQIERVNGTLYIVDKKNRTASPIKVDSAPLTQAADVPTTITINGVTFTVSQNTAAQVYGSYKNAAGKSESEGAQDDLTNLQIDNAVRDIDSKIAQRNKWLEGIKNNGFNEGRAPLTPRDAGYGEYQRIAAEVTHLENEKRRLLLGKKARPASVSPVTITPPPNGRIIYKPETPENFQRKLRMYQRGEVSDSDWEEYMKIVRFK